MRIQSKNPPNVKLTPTAPHHSSVAKKYAPTTTRRLLQIIAPP
ncbi:hypothetical protein OESDEN_13315 [Oesophagostomum dentatum]|uniref:Uncharacterized protein n=1 Tax=Oesophagostomum dentatum TaxID=61180 RepID=A0A0B1SSP5_OESDE|nr:hypothetical protein OESDEN_13315 [Oesophagostomum dentatum]